MSLAYHSKTNGITEHTNKPNVMLSYGLTIKRIDESII